MSPTAKEKLALEGGKPTRKEFLHFHRPCIEAEEEAEVLAVLRSGWLTTGPRTKQFEADFAKYTCAAHAVALNSCTAGLHLGLVALGVEPGDEVITTPITFAATANVIEHIGATPVFADVLPDSLNIDPDEIERRITTRTKIVVPVHFAGQPCDMERIEAIAKKHGLAVMEDAAHAVETVAAGRKVGSISPVTCFSFYATKNITTGEGGMLTTSDAALAERIQILSLHGISRDAWKRYSDEGYRHYEIIEPGYKYNMSDIQAALGLHQLRKVERFWENRKRLTELYDKMLADVPEVVPVRAPLREGDRFAYHIYVVVVRTEDLSTDRDVIMNAIQKENIGVGVHFRAIHVHPHYAKKYGFKRGALPNAEYASDRVISLPLFPTMTGQDVADVVAALRKVVTHFRPA